MSTTPPVLSGQLDDLTSLDDVLAVVAAGRSWFEVVLDEGRILCFSDQVFDAVDPEGRRGRDAFVELYRNPGSAFAVYRRGAPAQDLEPIGSPSDLIRAAVRIDGEILSTQVLPNERRPVFHELRPGDRVDGWEIVREIGRGGSSRVYAARQPGREPHVAIKVLAMDQGDPDHLRARFFRELLLASQVRHPNVVEVRGFGVTEPHGQPFIVMELLRGNTLHAVVHGRGALPEERVARLFFGATGGLAAIHGAGVVHQDIKPSNLFLRANPDGTEDLVLLDFGIARRVEGGSIDAFTATPRYAAPEYITRREARPPLDVYQMGLVMAEALAGRPVVTSRDPDACLRAHVDGLLEVPKEVRTSRLGPVILRALRTNPSERYADAAQLLDALRAAAVAPGPRTDETLPSVSSVHLASARRVPVVIRRRPVVPVLGLASLIAIAGFLLGLLAGALAWKP